MKPEKYIDFSLNNLQLLIDEKKQKLTLGYLSSKLKPEQFKRLTKSGLLGIKKNKKTISYIALNYSDFSNSLNVNVLLRGMSGGLIGEYGSYKNPKVNIVKGQDMRLVLTLLERWVVDGVDDIDYINDKLKASDEKKRAEQLSLDLATYLEMKDKGLIDWNDCKVYDIKKEKWCHTVNFRGKREYVYFDDTKMSSFWLGKVYDKGSFDYTLIMAVKTAVQSPEEIALEYEKQEYAYHKAIRSSSNSMGGQFENDRVACTSFSYDPDGRLCKIKKLMSSGNLVVSSV